MFFLSRSHHDDLMREKDRALAERDAHIAELKAEVHRLHDTIYQNNFGVQLFDSLPQRQPEPEVPAEAVMNVKDELRAQMASAARINPSRLPHLIEQTMRSDAIERAYTANPPKNPVAQKVFEQARQEATRA